MRLQKKDEEVELECVNERFNDELTMQIEGKLPQGPVYEMGLPGRKLLSTGIPNLPIRLQASVLNKKSNDPSHRNFENPKSPDENVSEDTEPYRIREDEPPKKTGVGYKVFVLKDGKLYPPMD